MLLEAIGRADLVIVMADGLANMITWIIIKGI